MKFHLVVAFVAIFFCSVRCERDGQQPREKRGVKTLLTIGLIPKFLSDVKQGAGVFKHIKQLIDNKFLLPIIYGPIGRFIAFLIHLTYDVIVVIKTPFRIFFHIVVNLPGIKQIIEKKGNVLSGIKGAFGRGITNVLEFLFGYGVLGNSGLFAKVFSVFDPLKKTRIYVIEGDRTTFEYRSNADKIAEYLICQYAMATKQDHIQIADRKALELYWIDFYVRGSLASLIQYVGLKSKQLLFKFKGIAYPIVCTTGSCGEPPRCCQQVPKPWLKN